MNGLPEDSREILKQSDKGVSDLYEDRYRGMVLFGSYARGEVYGRESDVDLLVLLEGEVESSWREFLKIEPISWPHSLESGYVLSIFPVNVESYQKPRRPFLLNARREGVSLV